MKNNTRQPNPQAIKADSIGYITAILVRIAAGDYSDETLARMVGGLEDMAKSPGRWESPRRV
jgi:hypothetical protein